MKKTGFTLIELLAVIVILAIIALIAVPIVVNIINDSKVSSEEESLKLYEDAINKMIVKKQMTEPTFNPSECTIKEDGNLKCAVGTKEIDVEVEIKGNKPNKGTVIITHGKTSLKNVEFNGKKYFKVVTLLEDNGDGKLSIGDKYEYEVKPGTKYPFYVLNVTNTSVDLVLANNICEDGTLDKNKSCKYMWDEVDNNNRGPIIAMSTLHKATKDWINVPDMIMNFEDYSHKSNPLYGYKGIFTDSSTKKTVIVANDDTTEYVLADGTAPLKSKLFGEGFSDIPYVCFGIMDDVGDNQEPCPTWFAKIIAVRSWEMDSSYSTEYASVLALLLNSIPVNYNYPIYPIITVSKSDLLD